MLGKRVLTAVIGIPIAAYIINYGEWIFALAILILTLLAWHEFCKMLQNKQIKVFYSFGMIVNVCILGCAWLGNAQEFAVLLFVTMIAMLMKMVFSGTKFTALDAAFSLLGICYIGMSFSHLLLLRDSMNALHIMTLWGNLPAGAAYVWLAFVGTWASDTFAYFVGSYLGKHKLCPGISPNKTIEGALGGVLGSTLVVTLLGSVFTLPVSHSMLMGLLVGIAAPLGDLVESAIKRFSDVKDSGHILPGHGGILDRFDSILFTAPVVYYYLHAFVL